MKRYGALAIIVALGVAALVVSQRRRVGTRVSPETLFGWLAGAQREATRLPAAATRMSDADEIRLGDRLAQRYEFLAGKRSPDDRAIEEYLNLVGRRVAGHAHRKLPYRFHYLPNPALVNAFALPGGHVYIGEGLLALMKSEDELAAAEGHEVEHIDHYHCAERARTEALLRKIPLGGLVGLPLEIFEAGYTKDQEMEADRDGTRLAVMAGYSPLGVIQLFQTFARLEHARQAPPRSPGQEISRAALESLQEYFRSHPSPAERLRQIREMVAANGWQELTRQRPLKIAPLLSRSKKKPGAKTHP